MAKVQYSSVVGDARGKIGGNVATKGRFGAVIRHKTSPVQPRTNPQLDARSSFTKHSKGWGALATDTARAAWDAFAKANPLKDVFGNTMHLTGHQMYVRLNTVIQRCLGSVIPLPPLSLAIKEPTTVAVTAVHGSPGVVTVTVTGPPTGQECAEVWAAAPQNPGRKFLGSAYRLLLVGAAAGAGPYIITTAFGLRFGALQVGQIVRVLVKYASKTTGAQGMGVEASCTTS